MPFRELEKRRHLNHAMHFDDRAVVDIENLAPLDDPRQHFALDYRLEHVCVDDEVLLPREGDRLFGR